MTCSQHRTASCQENDKIPLPLSTLCHSVYAASQPLSRLPRIETSDIKHASGARRHAEFVPSLSAAAKPLGIASAAAAGAAAAAAAPNALYRSRKIRNVERARPTLAKRWKEEFRLDYRLTLSLSHGGRERVSIRGVSRPISPAARARRVCPAACLSCRAR